MLICNICKQPGTIRPSSENSDGLRLVRDHNHITKEIRGILCERCNSYLGQFENNKPVRKKYKTWLEQYKEVAILHLQSHTGIRYHGRFYDKTVFENANK